MTVFFSTHFEADTLMSSKNNADSEIVRPDYFYASSVLSIIQTHTPILLGDLERECSEFPHRCQCFIIHLRRIVVFNRIIYFLWTNSIIKWIEKKANYFWVSYKKHSTSFCMWVGMKSLDDSRDQRNELFENYETTACFFLIKKLWCNFFFHIYKKSRKNKIYRWSFCRLILRTHEEKGSQNPGIGQGFGSKLNGENSSFFLNKLRRIQFLVIGKKVEKISDKFRGAIPWKNNFFIVEFFIICL